MECEIPYTKGNKNKYRLVWCGDGSVRKTIEWNENTSTNIIFTHKWSATWQNLRSMNLMNIKHPKKNSSQVPQKKYTKTTKRIKNKVIQISRYIFKKNKKLPFFLVYFSFSWFFHQNYFLKNRFYYMLSFCFLSSFCQTLFFFLCNSMSVVCVAFNAKDLVLNNL